MKSFPVITALAFIGGCTVAFAAERAISQKGRSFSERQVSIKRGEAILFVNDDMVAHNVLSTSAGNEFNIGSQPPGVATPVTFSTSGDVDVICAIHPRMRMTVKVTN